MISHTIIESHGGQLCASNNGRGTNFNFTLPVEAARILLSEEAKRYQVGPLDHNPPAAVPRSRDCTKKQLSADFRKIPRETSRISPQVKVSALIV